MTKWSHLPNAVHIDRVLASVKAKPGAWTKAYNATRVTARDGAVSRAASIAARNIAWNAARGDAWNAAYDAATDAARWSRPEAAQHVAVGEAARDAAWYAIAALVAYDDSAKYLDMPLDQLKMLYVLTEHPACSLLQPAVQAFSMEREPA